MAFGRKERSPYGERALGVRARGGGGGIHARRARVGAVARVRIENRSGARTRPVAAASPLPRTRLTGDARMATVRVPTPGRGTGRT